MTQIQKIKNQKIKNQKIKNKKNTLIVDNANRLVLSYI